MAAKKHIDRELAAIIKLRDEAAVTLRDALDRLDVLRDQQREDYDNMPESLQATERGETSDRRADDLDTLFTDLEEAIEAVEGIELEVE